MTCDDCHNVHEATSTVSAAPAIGGRMLGAWGVTLTDIGPGSFSIGAPARAANEYEVCARCHSSYVTLGGRPDIATDFNTYNRSVHAVRASSTAATATAGSYTAGWSNASVLRCTDLPRQRRYDRAPRPAHVDSRAGPGPPAVGDDPR